MKKLLLSLAILLSAVASSAQTVAGATVRVNNYTACDYYIILVATNPGGSCDEIDVLVHVTPFATNVPVTAPTGMQFEVARIADTYPSPTSYQVKILAPNAALGWTGAPTPVCYPAGSYPECMDMVYCTGLPTESCWTGSASNPEIHIVN